MSPSPRSGSWSPRAWSRRTARRPGTGSSARPTSSRLRYVLAAQRDQYLPLKVIKDHLDAIDRGLEPATPEARLPRPLTVADGPSPAGLRRDHRGPDDPGRAARRSGLTATSLAELEQFGLLAAGPGGYFDADAALVADRGRAAGGRPRAPAPAVVPDGGRPGGHPDHPTGLGAGAAAGPRRPGAGGGRGGPVWRRTHSAAALAAGKAGLRRDLGRLAQARRHAGTRLPARTAARGV